MGIVLHKYRGDSPFTESIITSGKVYLATAHELNDPFECTLQDICEEWMNKQVTNCMQAALAGFANAAHRAKQGGESFFGLERAAIHHAIDSVLSAGDLERSYEAWRTFILKRTGHPPSDCRAFFLKLDEQLVQTGIFSMSADPSHALMWAHYADQHRGVCLGFRQVTGSKLADVAHCLPVRYSDTLPQMDSEGLQTTMTMAMDSSGRGYTSSLKLSFTDKTFQRVVTSKPTCWSYEQEHRYIEPFGGLFHWPGALSECTFGLRCPEERRRHYIELLETNVPNEVQLFEMRLKHGTNSLERVPMETSPTTPRLLSANTPQSSDEPERLSPREFAARMEQLIQQERYGEVIYQTGENLKQDPSAPVLLHLKAVAHGRAHQHAEAYELFKKLTELFPRVAAGWYGMACALESLSQPDKAVPLLQRAADLDPNDASIALNLGVHLVRNRATQEQGIAHLRRAEKLGHRRARQIIDQVLSTPSDRGAVDLRTNSGS
jgi:tetratricopeptide (TPR) repeat protein